MSVRASPEVPPADDGLRRSRARKQSEITSSEEVDSSFFLPLEAIASERPSSERRSRLFFFFLDDGDGDGDLFEKK